MARSVCLELSGVLLGEPLVLLFSLVPGIPVALLEQTEQLVAFPVSTRPQTPGKGCGPRVPSSPRPQQGDGTHPQPHAGYPRPERRETLAQSVLRDRSRCAPVPSAAAGGPNGGVSCVNARVVSGNEGPQLIEAVTV